MKLLTDPLTAKAKLGELIKREAAAREAEAVAHEATKTAQQQARDAAAAIKAASIAQAGADADKALNQAVETKRGERERAVSAREVALAKALESFEANRAAHERRVTAYRQAASALVD